MNLFNILKLRLEQMHVVGDDDVGWSAKYSCDPNWCWATKRETVVAGCKQRRRQVLIGNIIRTKDGFYPAM